MIDNRAGVLMLTDTPESPAPFLPSHISHFLLSSRLGTIFLLERCTDAVPLLSVQVHFLMFSLCEIKCAKKV